MCQIDKAFYLKDLELALFLSIKGMKELYGFKMKQVQNLEQEFIYQTLFELEKKKLLSFQVSTGVHGQEKIIIDSELNQVLINIRNAGKMLLYTSRQSEHPDQCIYLGDEAVFVSVYGRSGNMNRLESVPLTSLPEEICKCGFYLEELISDKSLFQEAEIKYSELEDKADILFGKKTETLDEKEWECVTDCLRLYSLKRGECIKQYLLFRDKLNDYFIVTDKSESHVFTYSRKKIVETIRNDLYGN